MFTYMLLPVLISFSIFAQTSNPWVEIDTQIRTKQKKLDDINEELLEKMKPQFKQTPEAAEVKFSIELGNLKEEKQNLEKEIEQLTQELNYRYPERGLKSGLPDNTSTPRAVDEKLSKSVSNKKVPEVKEGTVDQTMKALRRQFGTPLSKEEIKELQIESIETKKRTRNNKPGDNPIDEKIIISK